MSKNTNILSSIVVPCYNHGSKLVQTVSSIVDACKVADQEVEVLIVTDGCTDNSEEVSKKLSSKYDNVHSLCFPKRLGKGGGVRKGVDAAKGQYVCFIDADMAIDPKYIPQFFHVLQTHTKLDIVVAARRHYQTSAFRKLTSFVYRQMNRWFFWLPVHDTQVGLKAFKTNVAKDIFSSLKVQGYAFDIDLLVTASLKGYKMEERPVVQQFCDQSNVTKQTILNMTADTVHTYHRMMEHCTSDVVHHVKDRARFHFHSLRHIFVYPLSWCALAAVKVASKLLEEKKGASEPVAVMKQSVA